MRMKLKMKLILQKSSVIMAILFVHTIAAQAGMPEAQDALKRDDFSTAIVELRPLADQGSAEAQVFIAKILYTKRSDAQSQAEAIRLFKMSANAENEEAMLILMLLYEKGEGVPRNQQESIKLARRLSERSNTTALLLLAKKYEEGQGVPQSSAISSALIRMTRILPEASIQDKGTFVTRKVAQLAEKLREPNNFQNALDQADREAALLNKKYANLPKAVKSEIAGAAAGDAASMVNIGILYLNGEKQVPRDLKLAAYWFQKAASLGDPAGRGWMANLYLEGIGVKKDYKAAFKLFSGLLSENYPGAEGKIGILYKDGLGVTKNSSRALYFLRKSIVGAVGENYFGLAKMYSEGTGVSKNPVVALALAKLSSLLSPQVVTPGMPAVDNPAIVLVNELKLKLSPYEIAVGSKLAGQLLGARVDGGNQLELIDQAAKGLGEALTISPAQVAAHFVNDKEDKDFPLALNLLAPLIENNDPEAQYLLGSMFEQGQGVLVDMQKANNLFGMAEAKGNVDALTRKGGIYERGEGVEKDSSKAFMAYEKAANRGSAFAQVKLADMLADGIGVDRNTKLAIQWYQKALMNPVDYWEIGALKGLAKVYINDKNFSDAASYLKKAAAKGDKESQLSLAEMYFEGRGVHRSMRLAFALTKLAQQDPTLKARALELNANAHKNFSVDDEENVSQLVATLSDLELHSVLLQKDARKFVEVLEAAEFSVREDR